LIIPVVRAEQQEPAVELFKQPAMIAAIIGIHLFVGIVLWVLAGPGVTLFLSLLIGTAEVLIWKRKPLSQAAAGTLKQWQQRQRELQAIELARKQASEQAAQSRPVTDGASKISGRERRNAPQAAVKPASSPYALLPTSVPDPTRSHKAEPIPPRPSVTSAPITDRSTPTIQLPRVEAFPTEKPARNWYGFLGGLHTLVDAGANLPPHGVEFFGPGTTLQLDRGTIVGALVYATTSPQHGSFDASLIDGSLPIAPPHVGKVEGLPYWPSYHDASPQQRSRYLDCWSRAAVIRISSWDMYSSTFTG
jgi:hypothetical protein